MRRHASDVSSLKASAVILPFVVSISGSRHLCGTPRWRHFLSADSRTPKSRAASSTTFQSRVIMLSTIRDELSLCQGTKWGAPGPATSIKLGVMIDDEKADVLHEQIAARTKALREAKRPKISMQQMATHLGCTVDAYKKYEFRTPLPHRYVALFCAITGATIDYLFTGIERLESKARRPRTAPKVRKRSNVA